jgi:hypothetical protein
MFSKDLLRAQVGMFGGCDVWGLEDSLAGLLCT